MALPPGPALPSYPTLTLSVDDLPIAEPAKTTDATFHTGDPAVASAQYDRYKFEITPHTGVQRPEWAKQYLRTMPALPVDKYSNSRPQEAVTNHMKLDFKKINFDTQEIEASVTYSYDNRKNVDTLVLDIYGTPTPKTETSEARRAPIEVERVLVNGEPVKWSITKVCDHKPDALEIAIPKDKRTGEVQIGYKTTPSSQGLFWRKPEETYGKKYPMLFTQAEAIDGAHFIPGQHSPQVRMTYKVNVNSPDPALMVIGSSMTNPVSPTADGKYTMEMRHPVPLYLLGIAIGNFRCHEYDNRAGVYAEPCVLASAAMKFDRLPKILEKTEQILGPYQWVNYRPVLLTYSYPFGAMEHPCCSFLAGDNQDRIYVIIHELIHSWLGNWTTNCCWEELIWNEGFTTYVQSLVQRKILGEDMDAVIMNGTIKSALRSMKDFKEKNKLHNTKLCREHVEEVIDITAIPYAKGALFFMVLEKAMGTDKMMKFITDYSNDFALKSMSKDRFLGYLKEWLKNNNVTSDFDKFMTDNLIEEWLSGEGIGFPKNCPEIKSKLSEKINQVAEKVAKDEDISVEFAEFKAQEPLVLQNFYFALEGKVTKEQLIKLDETFRITESERNILILAGWAPLCASVNYLTDKTKEMIQYFIEKRQSVSYTKQIANYLIKTPEGVALLEKIYKESSLDAAINDLLKNTLYP